MNQVLIGQCATFETTRVLDPVYMEMGDPGLVGKVSFVLCPPQRENKRDLPH